MENTTRVALISIIVENGESVEALNALLHTYGEFIVGRMGIPYRARNVSIIAIAIDAPQDTISTLSGKIGKLPLFFGVALHLIYRLKYHAVGILWSAAPSFGIMRPDSNKILNNKAFGKQIVQRLITRLREFAHHFLQQTFHFRKLKRQKMDTRSFLPYVRTEFAENRQSFKNFHLFSSQQFRQKRHRIEFDMLFVLKLVTYPWGNDEKIAAHKRFTQNDIVFAVHAVSGISPAHQSYLNKVMGMRLIGTAALFRAEKQQRIAAVFGTAFQSIIHKTIS
jgi:putative iron-only hydrogenase system regulator